MKPPYTETYMRNLLQEIIDQWSVIPTGTTHYDKDLIREMTEPGRQAVRDKEADVLKPLQDRLLRNYANGSEIDPHKIEPYLYLAKEPDDHLLFRYTRLTSSVITTSRYGRQLQIFVKDRQNNCVIGIIHMSELGRGPMLDRWLGWSRDTKNYNMRYLCDYSNLISVPPYSYLLGGKLVAMLAVSAQVMDMWRSNCAGRGSTFETKPGYELSKVRAVAKDRIHTGDILVASTMSAYGRSSIYNRLKFRDRLLYQPIGWTKGRGYMHMEQIREQIGNYFIWIQLRKGRGDPRGTPRWNLTDMIGHVARDLGMDPEIAYYHNVKRQIYAIPMCDDYRERLQKPADRFPGLQLHRWDADEMIDYWKQRWLYPRLQRTDRWKKHERHMVAVWQDNLTRSLF